MLLFFFMAEIVWKFEFSYTQMYIPLLLNIFLCTYYKARI